VLYYSKETQIRLHTLSVLAGERSSSYHHEEKEGCGEKNHYLIKKEEDIVGSFHAKHIFGKRKQRRPFLMGLVDKSDRRNRLSL